MVHTIPTNPSPPPPTPTQGLSDDQVHIRQRRDGPNAITPPKQLPEFLKFLKNLVGGFALLLWAAAIMSLVAYGIQQATTDGGDQSNVSVTLPWSVQCITCAVTVMCSIHVHVHVHWTYMYDVTGFSVMVKNVVMFCEVGCM